MIRQLAIGLLGAVGITAGLGLLCLQPVPFALAMVGGVVLMVVGIGATTWSVGA